MNFDQWFATERAKGLVDIKLSIKPGGTLKQVQDEILACEKQIELGNVRPLPKPTTFLSPEIQEIINSVKAE